MSQCISVVREDTLVRKFQKNEPYYAARWMLSQLVPVELLKKIKLEVFIRKMTHQHGNCWAYNKCPFEYNIVVNSILGRRESLRVIAHESVHVMQYATGKMKDLWGQHNRGKILWENKTMEPSDSGSFYYNSPWEKEAYGKQEKLMRAYLRHVKSLSS
jgi:hypothetical protein